MNNMKSKLVLFFLLIISAVCSAQSNSFLPSKVFLKSGDTIYGIGKFNHKINKNRIFKYKTHSKGKEKRIELSKIEFVQIRYPKGDIKTFKTFRLPNDGQFILLQEFVKGRYVEVYGYSNIVGYMPVVSYYIKKTNEEGLTFIGSYDAAFGKFKNKVYDYFSDCDLLIKKLKEKELRLRNGLDEIADFYNKNCGDK